MTDAERGEIFRSYVNRPNNHDGESYITKLLDRCQRAEATMVDALAEIDAGNPQAARDHLEARLNQFARASVA